MGLSREKKKDLLRGDVADYIRTIFPSYGHLLDDHVQEDMVNDVMESSDFEKRGQYSNDDISLAFQRVMLGRMGHPEWSVYSNRKEKFELRPAYAKEAGLFYALTPEQDEKLGCIGCVRMDFGRSGKEFYHTWHQRGPAILNSPKFKAELTELVSELRKNVLNSFNAMSGYCQENGGEIDNGWDNKDYGYIVETESYRYCLRCRPVQGEYQAYLTCFDLRMQEMNQQQTEPPEQGVTMGGMSL